MKNNEKTNNDSNSIRKQYLILRNWLVDVKSAAKWHSERSATTALHVTL